MAYNGSIELISGIKQKNNGTFPLVDSDAVRWDDSTSVKDKLTQIDEAAANAQIVVQTGDISSLPAIIFDDRITEEHVVVDNPIAEEIDVEWTTVRRHLILSGTLPSGVTLENRALHLERFAGETNSTLIAVLQEGPIALSFTVYNITGVNHYIIRLFHVVDGSGIQIGNDQRITVLGGEESIGSVFYKSALESGETYYCTVHEDGSTDVVQSNYVTIT